MTKDEAWEGFLARLGAGEFSIQQAPLVAFNAGYRAGLLDGAPPMACCGYCGTTCPEPHAKDCPTTRPQT